MPAYGSPGHFGVRPVLLRLLAPRHPPCALSSLSTLDVLFLVNQVNPALSTSPHLPINRQTPRRDKIRFPSSFVFAIQFSRNKMSSGMSLRSPQRQKSSYHTCFSGSTLKSLAGQPITAIHGSGRVFLCWWSQAGSNR